MIGIFAFSLLIAVVLTFILIYFLFRLIRPEKKQVKSSLFWLSVLIATPLLYAGFLWIWFLISSSYPERSFDKTAWIENKEKRYEYVDDLVDHSKLIGLMKSEIKEILGKPDNENDSTLTYYIGYSPRYFLNNDPDWLEIQLDNGETINTIILE